MEIKKVLVLGSNSFTGSHFVNYLLKNTDTEIIGISRSKEYNPVFLAYKYNEQSNSKFTFHQLDVNKDFEKIIQIINEEQPNVVVNYAAQGEVRNSWKWPDQWFETNCLGVVKIAQSLVGKSWLKRYISISTPEVYGSTEKNLKENHNYQPSTPYAASKLSGDLFLQSLHKHYNFPVIYTRAANLYGIHQQLYRIIPRTIIYLKLGKKIQLHGAGDAVRSFIHARDIANATWKTIIEGENGEVYHLAPLGDGLKIKDLVRTICEVMGHNFESSVEMLQENFGQDAMYSLNSSKARIELGWRENVSLKEGIKETISWIEDNWEEIKGMDLEYVHKV